MKYRTLFLDIRTLNPLHRDYKPNYLNHLIHEKSELIFRKYQNLKTYEKLDL